MVDADILLRLGERRGVGFFVFGEERFFIHENHHP